MGPGGSQFFIAVVAAVLGSCVAACSSPVPTSGDTTNVVLPQRGVSEKTPDDDPPPTKADSAPLDAGTGGAKPMSTNTTCPAAPPPSYPTWVPPTNHGKPCTVDDLQAYLTKEGQPVDDQKTAMAARNPSCASCIFTKETDTSWGPITKTNDNRAFIDFGLCYYAAGASKNCGSAAQSLEWCVQKICNVCLSGQNPSDCRNGAFTGACKSYYDGTMNACNNYGDIVNTTCGGSGNVVGVLCGGT